MVEIELYTTILNPIDIYFILSVNIILENIKKDLLLQNEDIKNG